MNEPKYALFGQAGILGPRNVLLVARPFWPMEGFHWELRSLLVTGLCAAALSLDTAKTTKQRVQQVKSGLVCGEPRS